MFFLGRFSYPIPSFMTKTTFLLYFRLLFSLLFYPLPPLAWRLM